MTWPGGNFRRVYDTARLPPSAFHMNSPNAKQLAVLRSGQWFSTLPQEFQDELVALSRVIRLAPGQSLFTRGAPADGLYAVVEGCIRISVVSDDGREAILNLFEAPHWFGEVSLFDGQPRTHDAQAEGEAVLVHLLQEPLLKLLGRSPRYWEEMGRLMTHKIRHLLTLFDDAALQPAQVRLARRLLAISGSYGEVAGGTQSIRVSQEQLGQMVGVTRQTANLILRGFEADGMLRLGRGYIRLIDLEALRHLAP